jgi:hypothetical protein
VTGAPGTRPVVTPADTARARVLVATWEAGDDRLRVPTGNLLELRGLVAAALADARAEGFQEGHDDALDVLLPPRPDPSQ